MKLKKPRKTVSAASETFFPLFYGKNVFMASRTRLGPIFKTSDPLAIWEIVPDLPCDWVIFGLCFVVVILIAVY